MDDARAVAYLQHFLDLALAANSAQGEFQPLYYDHAKWVELDAALLGHLRSAQQVAQQIDPSVVDELEPNRGMYDLVWESAVRASRKLLGILRERETVAAILAPSGPTLAAVGLHPWVWDPAAKPWDVGHRRSAIQSAATRIEMETQGKLERWDVSGSELASQAWSNDPPAAGRHRLRPAGYDSRVETSRSELAGARHLHLAVVGGIRNIASHQLDEPTEQVALEELAALSLLARWIDGADVLRI
jgi:hypothetical protein